MPTPTPIRLDIHAAAGKAFVPYLRRMMTRVVGRNTAPSVLSIALVGDATMSRLHLQFMSIPGPTDVLTFELAHDPRGNVTEGEIVVCVPEARRQASKLGTQVRHELLLYAVHGLLHLTGHDDLDDAAHRRMHRAEDRILVSLGVGPVFKPVNKRPVSSTTRALRSKPSRITSA